VHGGGGAMTTRARRRGGRGARQVTPPSLQRPEARPAERAGQMDRRPTDRPTERGRDVGRLLATRPDQINTVILLVALDKRSTRCWLVLVASIGCRGQIVVIAAADAAERLERAGIPSRPCY